MSFKLYNDGFDFFFLLSIKLILNIISHITDKRNEASYLGNCFGLTRLNEVEDVIIFPEKGNITSDFKFLTYRIYTLQHRYGAR